jgi:hypothetical protein
MEKVGTSVMLSFVNNSLMESTKPMNYNEPNFTSGCFHLSCFRISTSVITNFFMNIILVWFMCEEHASSSMEILPFLTQENNWSVVAKLKASSPSANCKVELHATCFAYSLTLTMGAIHSFKMSVNFYQTIWCYIPKDSVLYIKSVLKLGG